MGNYIAHYYDTDDAHVGQDVLNGTKTEAGAIQYAKSAIGVGREDWEWNPSPERHRARVAHEYGGTVITVEADGTTHRNGPEQTDAARAYEESQQAAYDATEHRYHLERLARKFDEYRA